MMKSLAKRPELINLITAVNVAFGSKLRRLRRAQEVSQGELASRVGLSRVTVATIEGGKQNIQLHQMFLFARALDVPLEQLVPTIQEVEQHRAYGQPGDEVDTSGVLFLRDARELLLQLKRGSEHETANKKAD